MDGPLGAATFVALGLLGGIVLAWGVSLLLGGSIRAGRGALGRARGGERPTWAPGIWHCADCLSTNPPTAERCARCRAPRRELRHDAVEPRPDFVAPTIPVPPDVLVTLVHDPDAHADPGVAHWRLQVGGQRVAWAYRRDGALAMLRAIDGSATIQLDALGTGARAYRLEDVIARFAGPTFPIDVPCPERVS